MSARLWELKSIIAAKVNSNIDYVVIDEIQKIPDLFNEVNSLIEKQNLKFLLTGSSARKLKK